MLEAAIVVGSILLCSWLTGFATGCFHDKLDKTVEGAIFLALVALGEIALSSAMPKYPLNILSLVLFPIHITLVYILGYLHSRH